MSSAKHTPGSWFVAGLTEEGYNIGNGAVHIATVKCTQCISMPEAKDNADLIAAAPFLLEELERLVARVEFEFGPMGWLDMAEAAINQAKGYK